MGHNLFDSRKNYWKPEKMQVLQMDFVWGSYHDSNHISNLNIYNNTIKIVILIKRRHLPTSQNSSMELIIQVMLNDRKKENN